MDRQWRCTAHFGERGSKGYCANGFFVGLACDPHGVPNAESARRFPPMCCDEKRTAFFFPEGKPPEHYVEKMRNLRASMEDRT